ncbi:MAG: Gfo/Idh/MocA family oxidoreductase [Alphaproteobacteria bacterium]|nr:Gfo/Idh/MocA family oxidoreductase [Alphaproteobacteria bacterium]
MTPLNIGLIGCGNISDAYLTGAKRFPYLNMVACADIDPAAASAKAEKYDLAHLAADQMLADPQIDIVLNLTTPQHHVSVALSALHAGKHTYSEKPLGVSLAETDSLVDFVKGRDLRIGCAPDTFLGGAHQTARKLMDAGAIGDPLAGTAFMMVPGHESWHPNPEFYYKHGGGPLMDMGPYYLTDLINLLGPVSTVCGTAKASYRQRTIGSGDKQGETITVDVPTHISALLVFENGAAVTLVTSFDVHKHGHNPIEIYGTKGSMIVADPNDFDGDILVSEGKGDWQTVDQKHLYGDGNYRIVGLADMAEAIIKKRPHRASLELSRHVLEVMESILIAAETGQTLTMEHQCQQPLPLSAELPVGQLYE